MAGLPHLAERKSRASTSSAAPRWRDGDLVWLGVLLSVVSAALMIALIWWLVS